MSSCRSTASENDQKEILQPIPEPLSKAEQALATMSLEEKVGQLFFLSIPIDDKGRNILSLNDFVLNILTSMHPGGIILFNNNIDTPEQTWQLTQDLQKTSAYPLFIGIDEEGGKVSRLYHHPKLKVTIFPDMAKIGIKERPDLMYKVGSIQGSELHVLGINLNMAPIADINNYKGNPIGLRAFHWTAEKAAPLVGAYVEGLQSQGVMAVLKHFPGHGATQTDSHSTQAISPVSYKTLKGREWLPFKSGVESGADWIMMGHLTNFHLDSRGLPGTLSRPMVDMIHHDLNFDGLIVSDALNMGAIVNNYNPEEVAYYAYLAGIDQFLMPSKPLESYLFLLKKFKDKLLSEDDLNKKVLKILRIKEKWKLFNTQSKPDFSILNSQDHQDFVTSLGIN